MSDSTSPSIGEIVDANVNDIASDAATNAAAQTAASIPDTTVVVEDNPTTTDPALALDYADQVRAIAREEANNNLLAWMALAEANKPEEPKVVVVEAPEPEPPPIEPPKPTEPEKDKAPPTGHRYFQPLGAKRRFKEGA